MKVFLKQTINVNEPICNQKTLKQLIQFHRPPKANELDRLSIKKTQDPVIRLVKKKSTDGPKQIKVVFEAALTGSCCGRQSIAA